MIEELQSVPYDESKVVERKKLVRFRFFYIPLLEWNKERHGENFDT